MNKEWAELNRSMFTHKEEIALVNLYYLYYNM